MAGRLVSCGLAICFFMDPAFMAAQQISNGSKLQLIAELPDSPSTSQAQNASTTQTLPSSPASSAQNNSAQTGTPTQPTGTAAAPAITTTGNAASRPAGAAIAPPKQRQVRSFLIKFGFIAGAGAALGTVAALSMASPSRVPGSH
ncbi:MAG TPA: hypothetical protein VFA74_11695 [Terriglobales bacterium]|nr:hypothetical protein [Terriglobales bacterium]